MAAHEIRSPQRRTYPTINEMSRSRQALAHRVGSAGRASIALRLLGLTHGLLDFASGLLHITLRFQFRAINDFTGDFLGLANDDVAIAAGDISGARFHRDWEAEVAGSRGSTPAPLVWNGGETRKTPGASTPRVTPGEKWRRKRS